jgi:hypothetical protein
MDFIIGLPKSEGKSVIMVVVGRLTKYAHFRALSHPFKASTISTAFMETIQKLHENPKIIVSDRDPIFTGNFWTKLFSFLRTQLAHISSYHLQSDGKTEIVNKCLEGYLRCFVSDKQTQWVKWLPLAKWWYNTSFHIAKKMTPFMELYGYQPPYITSYLRENSKVQAVEHDIEHQQQVLQLLKDNLVLAQNRMKRIRKCLSSKLRRIINYHQSIMVHTRCCKRLVLWHTSWSFLQLLDCTQFSMFHV